MGHRKRANQSMIKDPAPISPDARGYAAYPGGHAEGYPDRLVQLFKEFSSCIGAGNFAAHPVFPTLTTGQEEMVLCDAIAESARERRWITLK